MTNNDYVKKKELLAVLRGLAARATDNLPDTDASNEELSTIVTTLYHVGRVFDLNLYSDTETCEQFELAHPPESDEPDSDPVVEITDAEQSSD